MSEFNHTRLSIALRQILSMAEQYEKDAADPRWLGSQTSLADERVARAYRQAAQWIGEAGVTPHEWPELEPDRAQALELGDEGRPWDCETHDHDLACCDCMDCENGRRAFASHA